MPEGPEIRREADQIARAVEGHKVDDIEVGLERLIPDIQPLIGATVTAVETRGKALLTHFDTGFTIYSHNQLYGRWFVMPRGDYPETNRQLRLALHGPSDSALLYSASDITVWQTSELHMQPLLAKLGPDILSEQLTVEMLEMRLSDKRFSKRALSALYLDQAFIAGSGNYLRSEILFDAGILPTRKPSNLSATEKNALANATISVAKRSYLTHGYTIPDAMYADIDTTITDYEGARFMAFAREELPCRACGTLIRRGTLNGRRIYWCDVCQH